MKFCTMEGHRICWIYPENRLTPLPNVYSTTLSNPDNLLFLPGDDELVPPAPSPSRPLQPYLGASSSSQPSSSQEYVDIHATFRSIQEAQVPLRVYVRSEHTVLHDFAQ